MRTQLPSSLFLRGLSLALLAVCAPAHADDDGHLLLSRSVYPGTGSSPYAPPVIVPGKTALPGGGTAVADGTYPNVFLNAGPDGSFGVTSPIYVDVLSTSGHTERTIPIDVTKVVTSFSSKSEIALNLTPRGNAVTFMAYVAPVSALDVSNSNTPSHVDPTNPVAESYQRAVVQLGPHGLKVMPVNGYSGNNGRAVLLAKNGRYYMSGNAGNGGNPQPASIIDDTGVLMIPAGGGPECTQVGTFSVTQEGFAADKLGKDSNFRGLATFGDTLYVTKGSGGNGIDTVYQVGTKDALPTQAVSDNPNQAGNPTNMSILPGFPTQLAKSQPGANGAGYFPFGIWFADANTLYVADEGDSTAADAGVSAYAGLQKWTFANGTWSLAYVLQGGLGLGQQYTVSGLPAAIDPATDGLRNIAGRHNEDGTVTLYAITSTVSASGDQGADPNRLVTITDRLSYTTATQASQEQFRVLKTAGYGEVLRGVAVVNGEDEGGDGGDD
jgi:hypothetical protein